MTVDNQAIMTGQPPHLEWRVYKGDTTAMSVGLFEKNMETAVDITGWTFAAKIREYPDATTSLQTINISVNENFLTVPIVTATLPNVSYFDIQGTYTSTNTIRTIVAGTIYAETDVTR